MGTNLRLLIFFVLLAIAFVGSDAALRAWPAFWTFAQRHPYSEQTIPLQMEARILTSPPSRLDVAIIGSSVAETDIDVDELTAHLGRVRPRIAKFPLPASVPVESAMMISLIEHLAPKIVVYPVTLWSLQDRLEWDVVRFYDPGVALSLFTWPEIARDHDWHASGLLQSAHVILRHRDAMRRTLGLWLAGGWTVRNQAPPRLLFADVQERAEQRAESGREDFRCPSVHTRALDYLGRRLDRIGIQFLIVATPVASRWQKDRKLLRMMDTCLTDQARAGGYQYHPASEVPEIKGKDFRDALHMSESGRAKFTKALAAPLMAPLHGIRVREQNALR